MQVYYTIDCFQKSSFTADVSSSRHHRRFDCFPDVTRISLLSKMFKKITCKIRKYGMQRKCQVWILKFSAFWSKHLTSLCLSKYLGKKTDHSKLRVKMARF